MALIIGIAGGSAFGKTSICEHIINEIKGEDSNKKIALISLDNFYFDVCDGEDPFSRNWDHISSYDIDAVYKTLVKLKNSESVSVPEHNYITHRRKENAYTITADVVLLEGIHVLTNEKIRNMLDIKVFIDSELDVALCRRIKRDITYRGYNIHDIIDRYLNVVKPAYIEWIEPTKRYADIIIPNNNEGIRSVQISILKTKIMESN